MPSLLSADFCASVSRKCSVSWSPRRMKGIILSLMAKKDLRAAAIKLHKKLGGKIRIQGVMPVKSRADLSLIYTPGAAAVSSILAKNKKLARDYAIKGKMIAVISDGSAVLGLCTIGPYGALPGVEGKCAL